MAGKVLTVGRHPSVVDDAKWPGPTPEKLEAALRADERRLNGLGHVAAIGFIHGGDTAIEQVEGAPKKHPMAWC